MKRGSEMAPSPLRLQVADALRRARHLPIGPDRNDLRQLAIGLLWLERHRDVRIAAQAVAEWRERRWQRRSG
jgi:hypothetical protein